jgi:hypothetical protein
VVAPRSLPALSFSRVVGIVGGLRVLIAMAMPHLAASAAPMFLTAVPVPAAAPGTLRFAPGSLQTLVLIFVVAAKTASKGARRSVAASLGARCGGSGAAASDRRDAGLDLRARHGGDWFVISLSTRRLALRSVWAVPRPGRVSRSQLATSKAFVAF